MDYSGFRRSENVDVAPQEYDPETAHLLGQMIFPGMFPTYQPNYPLVATPEQMASPLSQAAGLHDLIRMMSGEGAGKRSRN